MILLHDLSASTADGSKFATAVPDVVITITFLPEADESPRAWNPADLSSIELNNFIFLLRQIYPAANAKGADLLPGHKIKNSTPISAKECSSCKLLKKFLHSIDDVIIYI